MPFELTKTKEFNDTFENVYKSAYLTVKKLGGKIAVHDPEHKQMKALMDKKLQGKVLGDRSQLEFSFTVSGLGPIAVKIYGYPLNAVGQKLMFGARPGVVETVISAIFEEMDAKLKEGF